LATVSRLNERTQQLKEKWPGYTEILQFYEQVRSAQLVAKASLTVKPVTSATQWAEHMSKGLSMVSKEDFFVDIASSTSLFQSLLKIGEKATPLMAKEADKISRLLAENKLDMEKLLMQGTMDQTGESLVIDMNLDPKIFSFLIRNSIRPSVEAGAEHFGSELATELWRQSRCPLCGSPPALNLLKGEVGKRYCLCSYCSYQWRIDRLSCANCGSSEQDTLSYFCGEDEEAHRIDLCDACNQYIKTIDYRILEESDPFLEDIATFHLDVLAVQKGYTRAVPNPWVL